MDFTCILSIVGYNRGIEANNTFWEKKMNELRKIAECAEEIMFEDKKIGKMSAMVRAIQESDELICDDQFDEIEEIMDEIAIENSLKNNDWSNFGLSGQGLLNK